MKRLILTWINARRRFVPFRDNPRSCGDFSCRFAIVDAVSQRSRRIIAVQYRHRRWPRRRCPRPLSAAWSNGVYTNEDGYVIRIRQSGGALLDLSQWDKQNVADLRQSAAGG